MAYANSTPMGAGGPQSPAPETSAATKAINRSYSQFNSFLQKGKIERIREKTNHDLNDGTNNAHWTGLDEADLLRMANEGRHASTINFTKQCISTIAGGIIADKYEAEYLSGYGQKIDAAEAVQELNLRDQGIGNWEGKISKWVREACIYRGTLAWVINTSVDPRGMMDLIHIPPDRMIYDPNWMTTDVNDNSRIFEFTYKLAREIQDEFADSAPWVKRRIAGSDEFEYSTSTSTGMLVKAFDLNPDMRIDLDGELLVINEYWLEMTTSYRIFDSLTGMYRDDVPEANRKAWVLNERLTGGLETSGLVSLVPEKRYVEKFRSYCPTLSMNYMLSEGDYPVQVNGYHFIPLTCDLLNGKPNTPTDQLADPQRMVNRRMSTETYILATNGTNGLLANPKMFASYEEYERWIAEGHKPGYKGPLGDDAAANEMGFVEIPRQTTDNNYLNSTKNLMAMKDQTMPAVDALRGIADPGQSGVAYQAQVNQANTTIIVMKTFIKEGFHKLHETYFSGARNLYTYPIVLPGQQVNKLFRLNYGTPDSIDVPSISRLNIVVQESPTSASKRSVMVTEAGAAMQYLDQNSLQKHVLGGVIAVNLPHLSEDDRKRIEAANDLEQANYVLDAQVKQGQLRLTLKNIEAQLKGEGGGGPAPVKAALSITYKGNEMTADQLEIAYANGLERPQPPAAAAGAAPTGGAQPTGTPQPVA